MSRFLVTGATGFIGRAIVRRLIADGHRMLALSSTSEPSPPGAPQVEWRKLDLLEADESEIAAAIAGEAVSHCLHAAWYTNHADYLTHPVNQRWVEAGVRLAAALRAVHGGRFVGLGTCLEYDVENAAVPCAESATALVPVTLYARCKRDLFEQLGARGGDFAWARVFFVYGPGDRAGRLIPAMLDQFARGVAAGPSFGGLRRDYIYVDDLASQLVRIATSPVQGAINTGTGNASTLTDLFAAGARAVGRPELALANALTGDQPPLIAADMTRFRREVGEPAARSVADGLADLVGLRA